MIARYDFIVVGGGIAGVSVAYELAAHGSVCLLKYAEEHPDTAQTAVILITGSGLKDTSIFLSDPSSRPSSKPQAHTRAPLAEALT